MIGQNFTEQYFNELLKKSTEQPTKTYRTEFIREDDRAGFVITMEPVTQVGNIYYDCYDDTDQIDGIVVKLSYMRRPYVQDLLVYDIITNSLTKQYCIEKIRLILNYYRKDLYDLGLSFKKINEVQQLLHDVLEEAKEVKEV